MFVLVVRLCAATEYSSRACLSALQLKVTITRSGVLKMDTRAYELSTVQLTSAATGAVLFDGKRVSIWVSDPTTHVYELYIDVTTPNT